MLNAVTLPLAQGDWAIFMRRCLGHGNDYTGVERAARDAWRRRLPGPQVAWTLGSLKEISPPRILGT